MTEAGDIERSVKRRLKQQAKALGVNSERSVKPKPKPPKSARPGPQRLTKREKKAGARAERLKKYPTLDEGSTSLRTVSGGGVETNRRKH